MGMKFNPFTGNLDQSVPLDDGTAQGQMAFWDNALSKWVKTETSELFWDDVNKRLGVGTASPQQLLHINNSIAHEIGLRIEGVRTAGGTRYVDISVAGDGRVNFGGNFLSFNFDKDVKVKDNIKFIFGNNNDNWFKYDEWYSNDFEFWSSDIDGSGTDGIVWFNHKGTDDMIFSGKVGIGTTTPATSAKVEIASTTGALLLPRMTTTQKNALTPVNGMILYDLTLNKVQVYEGGAWASVI